MRLVNKLKRKQLKPRYVQKNEQIFVTSFQELHIVCSTRMRADENLAPLAVSLNG